VGYLLLIREALRMIISNYGEEESGIYQKDLWYLDFHGSGLAEEEINKIVNYLNNNPVDITDLILKNKKLKKQLALYKGYLQQLEIV